MKKLNYKDSKKLLYRNQIDSYISMAEEEVKAGRVWKAKQYLKIAANLSDQLVTLDKSNRSSRSLKKHDKRLWERFEALYPDTVELPV